MIVFDCERIKCENTGISHFCRNLAKAIIKENSESDNLDISFYLRKRNLGVLGPDADYVIYRSLHKYIFPYWLANGGLWHTTIQYPAIMPARGKILLTIHDLNFLYENTKEGPLYWKKKLQKKIDRATEIVTISEFAKKDIVSNMDLKGKRITVIHNGCERYEGKIIKPENAPEKEFLYTIGATLEKKNYHVLPALLQGNDLLLLISGGIEEPYYSKIMAEAKKAGVSDRVIFTGGVDECTKHWYLQNCKALVFPSIAEGFGLPPIEAMRYGKPVFLSQCTSLPEIGGDAAFYFNREFDPEKMKEEFNEGIRKYESGEISPEYIKRHAESFSWETAAREYIKVYKRILSY